MGMTTKADFNAEEWATIQEAPLLAGMRVIAAGRGGTLRETMAMGQVYAEARRRHADAELLDDLVSTPPVMDPSRFSSSAHIATLSAERLGEAARILRSKALPEEFDAYRRFVVDVARAAAVAHREGGFLGIGGEQVGDEEQAALDEIEVALQQP
jgi:hypothetical protein